MAPIKLLNLLAISSLAILSCSFGVTPANALSHAQPAVHAARGHGSIAKRKRSNSTQKRCRPRVSSSFAPASSTYIPDSSSSRAPEATTAAPAPTTTKQTEAAPTTTKAATTTTKQTEAAPTTTASSSGGNTAGGGKRGLAWALGADKSLSNFVSNKVQYIYTWSPYIPDGAAKLGLKPVPMFWGEKQASDFQKMVVEGSDDYADFVLGFNEPNQFDQGNMTPQRAAQLWKQYIDPLKNRGYKLISPACTSAPSGLQWTKDFLAACDGCTVDAIAVHYYDVSADAMIAYVKNFHNVFGKPIWITEYACQNFNGGAQCTHDEVFAFMDKILKFADETSWVETIFPFGIMHDMYNVNVENRLMADSGAPTDLGKLFLYD